MAAFRSLSFFNGVLTVGSAGAAITLTTSPLQTLSVVQSTAIGNARATIATFERSTTAVSASGFGLDVDMKLENDGGGAPVVSGRLSCLFISPVAGAENSALFFSCLQAGVLVSPLLVFGGSMQILDGASGAPSLAFQNGPDSGIWWDQTTWYFDLYGGTWMASDGAGIGFLGKALTPWVPTSVGADLTNNVTAGGTANTIDNIVAAGGDPTAASLVSTRNAMYQLAEKVRKLESNFKGEGLAVT